jgi:hypothetical protein
MKIPVLAVLTSILLSSTVMAQDHASAPVVTKGQMMVTANGTRLAPVYRVTGDGSAQVILDGKMVTIPASTLSATDGKLTTSLTKSEVLALH